jgi:hypothetical protein
MSAKQFAAKTYEPHPFWMICSWTYMPSFNCNYASTCIQHHYKNKRVWPHTFMLHLSK